MTLYFDNCVWQRFFEPLTTEEVKSERNTAERLLELRREGEIKIASSNADEAEFMPLINKGLEAMKDQIWEFVKGNTDIHLPTFYSTFDSNKKWGDPSNTAGGSRRETECLIEYFTRQGIKRDDAVHLATAIEECVSIFVTVDKRLLGNAQNINESAIRGVIDKHPKEKLKKITGASPTGPTKILSPEDALREVNQNLGMNT